MIESGTFVRCLRAPKFRLWWQWSPFLIDKNFVDVHIKYGNKERSQILDRFRQPKVNRGRFWQSGTISGKRTLLAEKNWRLSYQDRQVHYGMLLSADTHCHLLCENNFAIIRLEIRWRTKLLTFEETYGTTINWIKCCLSFALLRSSIRCIRSARSSCGQATRVQTGAPVDVVSSEAYV